MAQLRYPIEAQITGLALGVLEEIKSLFIGAGVVSYSNLLNSKPQECAAVFRALARRLEENDEA